MFAQQLLNGLVVGGVYALFAIGLTLVFGVHKILNLAHGGIFMLGALSALYMVQAGAPLWLAFVGAALVGGLLSVAVELACFRRLRRSGEEEFGAIVSSIGANLIFVALAQKLTQTQVLRFPFDTFPVQIHEFMGLKVSMLQVFMTLCAVVLVTALTFFLDRTASGRRIRTVAANERAASLVGINPGVVYFQTFFLAGSLAAAAGVLVGLAFNSIHFMMGESFLLQGFIVIILGGLGSIPGALIAGLVFGVIQTFSFAYLPSQLSDVILFGSLFVILMVRPNGLFGRDAAGSMKGAR